MEFAVCYARVSTVEQAEHGVSLDAQIERLASYCSSIGLQPVRIIREEPISASKPLTLRPGGRKLLQILADREVTHVVAMKLDRLFRSTQDALEHVTQWDANGITLHLVDMGGSSMNTCSAMGRMMYSLLASFAEFERNLISERTAAALAHKKSKRQSYSQTPYGFRKERGHLVVDEAEQGVLGEMFAWRKAGMTLYAIASRLNTLKVPSKKGGRWHSETVRHILSNDLYHEPADNLIPWNNPKKPIQPAEAKFMGQLTGVIKDLGGQPPGI